MDLPMLIPGQRWLDKHSNRVVVIVRTQCPPTWRYEDDQTGAMRRCDIEDFYLWGRFTPMPGG